MSGLRRAAVVLVSALGVVLPSLAGAELEETLRQARRDSRRTTAMQAWLKEAAVEEDVRIRIDAAWRETVRFDNDCHLVADGETLGYRCRLVVPPLVPKPTHEQELARHERTPALAALLALDVAATLADHGVQRPVEFELVDNGGHAVGRAIGEALTSESVTSSSFFVKAAALKGHFKYEPVPSTGLTGRDWEHEAMVGRSVRLAREQLKTSFDDSGATKAWARAVRHGCRVSLHGDFDLSCLAQVPDTTAAACATAALSYGVEQFHAMRDAGTGDALEARVTCGRHFASIGIARKLTLSMVSFNEEAPANVSAVADRPSFVTLPVADAAGPAKAAAQALAERDQKRTDPRERAQEALRRAAWFAGWLGVPEQSLEVMVPGYTSVNTSQQCLPSRTLGGAPRYACSATLADQGVEECRAIALATVMVNGLQAMDQKPPVELEVQLKCRETTVKAILAPQQLSVVEEATGRESNVGALRFRTILDRPRLP